MTPTEQQFSNADYATALRHLDEAELVTLCCQLINAASENPGGTEAPTVDVIEEYAHQHGLLTHRSRVAPGRDNIVVTLATAHPGAEAGPGVLFLGHSDVVPAGPGWSQDPFAATVRADRIYGRGASDMKGGLAAVLVALATMRRADIDVGAPISLVVTVDEEDLGVGVRHFIADPAAGLGPHAGDTFTGCIVAEPTDLELITACRGDAYLNFEITGKAAHSSRPSDGHNAITAAAQLIMMIAEVDEQLHSQAPDPLRCGSFSPGTITGGTGISMVAAHAELGIDRRLAAGEDAEAIARQLVEQAAAQGISHDGISLSCEVTMSMPGFDTPVTHPFVQQMLTAIQGDGPAPVVGAWSAACDGGFLAETLNVPVVIYGPGGLNDQAHQVNESVAISELITACTSYLRTVLGGSQHAR